MDFYYSSIDFPLVHWTGVEVIKMLKVFYMHIPYMVSGRLNNHILPGRTTLSSFSHLAFRVEKPL